MNLSTLVDHATERRSALMDVISKLLETVETCHDQIVVILNQIDSSDGVNPLEVEIIGNGLDYLEKHLLSLCEIRERLHELHNIVDCSLKNDNWSAEDRIAELKDLLCEVDNWRIEILKLLKIEY